jgi:hypothetical protein
MEKTGLDTEEKRNKFEESLEKKESDESGAKYLENVAYTPEANEMDFLRDHSMLATINEAKGKDLLFIIGNEHRKKLRKSVGNIPIMSDEDFIKKEEIKNKQAKYGIDKYESVEVLEKEVKKAIGIKPTESSFKRKKVGQEVTLPSLKEKCAQWHINGKVYNEVAQFIWQYPMVVEVWLPPNFVEENSKVKDWLLVWSWSSKNENKNEDSEP